MDYYTLDFETYYDDEYSLKKLTPVEYVLDPRFEMIMCAVKRMGHPPIYLEGNNFLAWLRSLDSSKTCFITHNALFDMCILAWVYDFIPKLIVDTLGISRAVLGHKLRSLALASVADHLGLGVKGNEVYKVKGMSAAAIKAAGLWDDYARYNLNDAVLCEGIFQRLVLTGIFPPVELAIMDMVLRCALQPQFQLDQQALVEHLNNIQQKKEHLLTQAMVMGALGRSALMSNEQFALLLQQHGVEPPTKISPVTQRVTYAFAKSDEDFLELQEHPNPAVQVLVNARLGHKSTLEETRTQRFIDISNLQWPAFMGAQRLMPVPLRYGGAHTHRLSGDWKLNMQNLPARGDASKTKLKRALIAPPNHKVVAADASQIEARIVAELCGQLDLADAFRQGRDVYCEFATDIFGFPVTKVNVAERFCGKTSILQLGFGAGWAKFQWSIAIGSLEQTGTKISLPDEEAHRIVDGYRRRYPAIPLTWRNLNNAISILAGAPGSFSIGGCVFGHGRITLPNGLHLTYENLRAGSDGWTYTYGGKVKRLYGGALLENIVQALARIITMEAALRVQKRLARYGIRLAAQVHDELVYIVPDEMVELTKAVLLEEMCVSPTFLPNLPLKAEAKSGQNYGEAK